MPGRRLRPPRGGHNAGALGPAGESEYGGELNQKIAVQIKEWRNPPIRGQHPYVYLDGISLERSWGRRRREREHPGRYRRRSGRLPRGSGCHRRRKENKASRVNFLRSLKARGLAEVRPFISDKCLGLVSSMAELSSCAANRYHQGHEGEELLLLDDPPQAISIISDRLPESHRQPKLNPVIRPCRLPNARTLTDAN